MIFRVTNLAAFSPKRRGAHPSCLSCQRISWDLLNNIERRFVRFGRMGEGKEITRWWFQTFFIFTPTWGMIQFDLFFGDGLKPPTRNKLICSSMELCHQKFIPDISRCNPMIFNVQMLAECGSVF